MRGIILVAAIVTIGCTATSCYVGRSCDHSLNTRWNEVLDSMAMLGAREVRHFLRSNEIHFVETPPSECARRYGALSDGPCRGGPILDIVLNAEPAYCRFLGAGPADITLRYSADEREADVWAIQSTSIWSDSIHFSVLN